MATINVSTTGPLTVTIVFTEGEREALLTAAAEESATLNNIPVSLASYLVTRIGGYLRSTMKRFKQRSVNELVEKFDAGTPEQRAAALAALDGQ